MASIFEHLSYGEFKRLAVCLCLDGVEYVFLFTMPALGEIFGVAALLTSLVMFGWIGFVSALDLVPDADILPINTIAWLVWILRRHWADIVDMVNKFTRYTDQS